MAKVIRQIEFDSKVDMKKFLHDEFDYVFDLNKEEFSYKNQELNDILVNLELEYKNDKVCLTISKLVTLKAFLLSKEQQMDIVDLIFKIDKIMNMSSDGLEKRQSGILDDNNLKTFLSKADIKAEALKEDSVELSDNKRVVSVECRDGSYDFNTIKLIKEF